MNPSLEFSILREFSVLYLARIVFLSKLLLIIVIKWSTLQSYNYLHEIPSKLNKRGIIINMVTVLNIGATQHDTFYSYI